MRGVEDHDDQTEPEPLVVFTERSVNVIPLGAQPAPKKEWDERQRPAGLVFWVGIVLVALVREVWALVAGQTTWTASAVMWWAAGPRWEPRWWLVYVGGIVPFLLWLIAHVGAREYVQGRELVAAVALGLAFALGGIVLNR